MSLSSTEFTEGLSYSLALYSALYNRLIFSRLTEKKVKLRRSSGNPPDFLALLHDGETRLEAHTLNFASCLINLFGLLLGDTLDVEHLLLGTLEKS